MPVEQITIPTPEDVKVYHHEQNRRITFETLNTLSGSSLEDSNLALMIKMSKAITGKFDAGETYLGLKVTDYTTSQINTSPGMVVTDTGIFKLPALNLSPNDSAFWGFYELELIEETGDNESIEFYDGLTFGYQPSPTRKCFKVNVYENYNNTASFPTVTLGRIKWFEYKKNASGPSQPIVNVTNIISKLAPSFSGFKTGDVKFSMKAGDGLEWITCTGTSLSTDKVDLIDFLRSVSSTTLAYNGIVDDAGRVRLTLSGSPNLKNILSYAQSTSKYSCLKFTSSGGLIPEGVYRIESISGNNVITNLPYNASYATATGFLDVLPYAVDDFNGGGARTPFPEYIRGFNPHGNSKDVNRLVNTYQDNQTEQHTHALTKTGSASKSGTVTKNGTVSKNGTVTKTGGVSGSGSGTFVDDVKQTKAIELETNYQYFSGDQTEVNYGWGAVGTNRFSQRKSTVNLSVIDTIGVSDGITISDGISISDGITVSDNINFVAQNAGGEDTDNPTVTRTDNLSLYLLIKS